MAHHLAVRLSEMAGAGSGRHRPKDIKKIAEWLRPDIVVVTSFGKVPVHVEFFESTKAVVEEKGYLVKALKPGGLLVLNADDLNKDYFKSLARSRVMTFGFLDEAEMKASNQAVVYDEKKIPEGTTFKVDHKGNNFPITLKGVLGIQHVYPALAALCVGLSQGINLVVMSESLRDHVSAPGRMKIIPGMNGSTIIDDTYNSSPVALEEAQDAAAEVQTAGRKIAVLGDMMELGKYSVDEHKKAGAQAARIFNILAAVGLRARGIAEGALDGEMDEKNIFQFDDSREAGNFLHSMIREGDLVLVKGSQSARMERTVEILMAKPEDAAGLLVRQDPNWKKR